jgi:hypothetical protein
MMTRLSGLLALILMASPAVMADDGATTNYYQFLTRDTVGATAFTKDHPTWDGRGVVVAILDTGVDPSVPGLRATSAGKLKVIEARDFSGQGDVKLKEARITTVGDATVFKTDKGHVKGTSKFGSQAADGKYWLGFFREKNLTNSSVSDINLNGHKTDVFAILAYRPKGGGQPVVVLDLNGNGTLADDQARVS